jgi:glucose/arabinose dehydrogenase
MHTTRLAAAFLALLPLPLAAQDKPQAEQPPDSVETSAGRLRIEKLATLEFPWGMAVLPDGRVLITEKPGRLRIWERGRLSEPIAGLPELVYRGEKDQGGLMDIAADPDFQREGWVYFSFVEAAEQQSPDAAETGDIRFGDFLDTSDSIIRAGAVARAKLDGNRLTDMEVIWRQTPKTLGRGHFGNCLVFAQDGTLFITSGERMRFDPAQSLSSNLGKVVRVNRDGSVPRDNPFVGKEDALGDIYSYGHRNTLAAAIDPANGNLWAFEMGPLGGDEVNLVRAGQNYGWPLVSNGDNYAGPEIPDHPSRPEFTQPVRTWTPVVSPSGAMFYQGRLFPGWRGSALVGGLSSQCIVRLVFDGERVRTEERIELGRRVRDVAEAPDGSILLLIDDKDGGLLRLTPGGGDRGEDGGAARPLRE